MLKQNNDYLLLDVASLNITNQEFEYDEEFGSDLLGEQGT